MINFLWKMSGGRRERVQRLETMSMSGSKVTMSGPLRAALAGVAMVTMATASQAAAQTPSNRATPAAKCVSLATLRLPDTSIANATVVDDPAATFKLKDVPGFCRVVAHVRSAPDSDIRVEIWLPLRGWAGVFHGNGNGGFGGTLEAG